MGPVTNISSADIEYNTSYFQSEYNMNEPIDNNEYSLLTPKEIALLALLYFSVLIGLLCWLCNAFKKPYTIITV